MRRALALLMIPAAAIVATPSLASGGVEQDDLIVELESPVEPLTFRATFAENETCVEGEFDAHVEANGTEVEPISVTQQSDPDEFLIVLPSDTPPGELFVDIECDDGDGTFEGHGTREWHAIAVTKAVTGPAPETATFTVHVACEGSIDDTSTADLPDDFAADLHYTVAGGVHYVYGDHAVDCTITEPNNGGAASTTITPEVVEVHDPDVFTVTVTNTFAAAAVVTQPTFTG